MRGFVGKMTQPSKFESLPPELRQLVYSYLGYSTGKHFYPSLDERCRYNTPEPKSKDYKFEILHLSFTPWSDKEEWIRDVFDEIPKLAPSLMTSKCLRQDTQVRKMRFNTVPRAFTDWYEVQARA